MRLAFVDFVYGYDAARPDTDEPVGGTTSAICFLAREMAAAGISCTLFNRIDAPHEVYGISSLPLDTLSDALEKDSYDAYIFCGKWTAELVSFARARTKVPLIGWMHESAFAEPMTPALDDFDGIVFVSEWQKSINRSSMRPSWKHTVIRNAVNPAIIPSFAANEPILAAKTNPPILLFAGSFTRGAFHIPPLLEKVRKIRSDFSVEMYCNLNPSRDPAKDEAYEEWLRQQPFLDHLGMVGQKELVRRMHRASLLLMPDPWPETSSMTLLEGMASGLDVVTTTRAALPELAEGFARQIPIDNKDEPVRFDMPVDYDAFAEAVLDALREREENPESVETRLRKQIDHFHSRYQWAQRVAPWEKFIVELVEARARSRKR